MCQNEWNYWKLHLKASSKQPNQCKVLISAATFNDLQKPPNRRFPRGYTHISSVQTVNLSLRQSICSLNHNPYFSAFRGVNRKACGELILPVRTGARRRRTANPERAGADVQRGRPRADRCMDACSQDQAGVLCQGGGDGEKDWEGEREDEWREGVKGGREGRTWEREGLISSSLSNETIGVELPPVWSDPKAVWTRGEKVGRWEAGTIQALAGSHTVSSGKDREFWIQQKRLPPSRVPFRWTSRCFFAWWKHSPPFHPLYFCFFWNKKLFRWPVTSTTHTHTHTAFPDPY